MPDLVRDAQLDNLRVRKERVHSTMLIELLALLIFLSMAFAFVQKEEGDRANPWMERFRRAQAELREARSQIDAMRLQLRQLEARVRIVEEANRLLRASIQGPLAANDTRVLIGRDQLAGITGSNENLRALLDQLQRENAALRARLTATGRGGTDLPRCLVSPGFLFRVRVSGGDAYTVTSAWPQSAAGAVAGVSGAASLGAGRTMSRSEFEQLAGQVHGWGTRQSPPCGFTVVVSAAHENLRLYQRQQQVIGRYFYAAYR